MLALEVLDLFFFLFNIVNNGNTSIEKMEEVQKQFKPNLNEITIKNSEY